jgi:hypothetical protein
MCAWCYAWLIGWLTGFHEFGVASGVKEDAGIWCWAGAHRLRVGFRMSTVHHTERAFSYM